MKPARTENIATALRRNIQKVIIGKDDVIDLVLTALLARGHILIEDVPGLGKTLLAKALARSIDSSFQRIQFTPDLLPSDVTGNSFYNDREHAFEFRRGPVFANILLGDELNRATPRTQSALLEAMEEHQVTVDGQTHPLPPLFFVAATQNPVEQQGVYTLPEAQLDRFLMQISVGYPARADEIAIIQGQIETTPLDSLQPVAKIEDVVAAQKQVRQVHADETIADYVVRIAEASRTHPDVILGASPRGSLGLLVAAQAMTFLSGADYVSPDTVKKLAAPVLRHRLMLKPTSVLAGRTPDQVIHDVLDRAELPLGF
ncbi:MAG: MoxR family ATPase [Candidatus Sumerlaeaceae bacterium]|nr:MoxR family ATPase [Candidatus Sumerlaeaceae bacterium]